MWVRLVGILVVLAIVIASSSTALTVSAGDHGKRDRETDRRTGHKLGKRAVLIYDNFNKGKGESIEGRSPKTGPDGETWQVELGSWEVKRGGIVETSPDEWRVASDKRAIINAGRTDIHLSARIRHEGDEQFVGIVTKYDGPVDWLMFWYDGFGDLVLGAKRSGSGQPFWDLKRVPFQWKPGKKHTLSLEVRGESVKAYLDSDLVIEMDDVMILGDATYVGIYSRGSGDAQFQWFRATGQERLGRTKGKGHGKSKKFPIPN